MQANLTALRLARKLEHEQRPARGEEQRLLAAWSGWVRSHSCSDQDRPEWAAARVQLRELAGEYNGRFNSLVLRDYTAEGERLTLLGLARTFTPPAAPARRGRPDHRRAGGRLFHRVGAGKTAEMICAAMELRRFGLIAKPAVVVPNMCYPWALPAGTRAWGMSVGDKSLTRPSG